MTDDQRWQAVVANDRRFDGVFFYGVTSTGVFCRPSCPSRPPRRDRVQFFPSAQAAGEAGFESLSAFYRAFLRELGCSPGTYRTKEMSP